MRFLRKGDDIFSFRKRIFKNKVFTSILILLPIIFVSLYLFIIFFLTPVVKQKIIASVHKSSKGLYSLQMDDFKLKFWRGAFHMQNVRIVQDTLLLDKLRKKDPSANLSNIDIVIDEIGISRIWWQNFLFNRSLKVGKIQLSGPRFVFKARSPVDTLKIGEESFLELLPGIIASFAGSLKIEELRIDRGKLFYDVMGKTGLTSQKVNDLFLDMKHIEIDTISPRNALFTNDVHFSVRNYELITGDQLFKLEVKKISGSYADSLLSIDSIHFDPLDKYKAKDQYHLFVREIQTTGINYSVFFKEKKVLLGTMHILYPEIDVVYHLPEKAADSSGNSNENLLQTILPYIGNTFIMKRFIMENGNFRSDVRMANEKIKQKAANINLTLNEIQLDSATIKNGRYWKTLSAQLSGYEGVFSSKNIKLSINQLDASSAGSRLNLRGVQVVQLHKSEKGEQMYYKNFVKAVQMSGIDYYRLLYGRGISLKDLDIIEMRLEIFHDSNVPDKGVPSGEMPNEFIGSLPFYLRIDNLKLAKAQVLYPDYSPKVKEPGKLSFENTNLKLSNITNDPELMTFKNPARVAGTTMVMGKGLLSLDVKVNLLSKKFECSYTGNLGPMDATCFNSFLEYGGMRLQSGTIEAQNFQVSVKDGKATGNMLLLYHNLDAQLVNKKTGKVKQLFSHLANFVLKNDNKRKEQQNKPKTAVVEYSREKEDGFLSYIWASISESIVKTVVKDFFEPLIPKKKK